MIAHAALSSGDFPWRYSLPAMLVLCVFPVGSFVVAPQLGEDVTAVLACECGQVRSGVDVAIDGYRARIAVVDPLRWTQFGFHRATV